jgi:hypothetical protein
MDRKANDEWFIRSLISNKNKENLGEQQRSKIEKRSIISQKGDTSILMCRIQAINYFTEVLNLKVRLLLALAL